MPQGRDRWIFAGICAALILVIAVFAVAGAYKSQPSAGSAPAAVQDAPKPGGGTSYTIRVTASGAYQGDIGYIDSAGQYRSQSVSGSGTGSWTVSGKDVTATMQNSTDHGSVTLDINGQTQSTTAPYGVVTLSVH